jgi:thiamine-monophosphate kinase
VAPRNGAEAGALDEFQRIRRFFAPLAAGCPGALGLTDDAAVLAPDAQCELVVTADMVVEGVHFLADDPPDLVARKALRVNLSDLAAKASRPLAYLQTLALPPRADEAWLARYAEGLAVDQGIYGIHLAGGDSTSTSGPITISITAFGQVPCGRAVRRSGARAGERVFVTGTIGDGALGLAATQGGLAGLPAEARQALVERYRLPQPRVAFARVLGEVATAALDVSDGLVADLGHLCAASGVGATLDLERVPLSEAARAALNLRPELIERVLAGGDDYEVLFAAPGDRAQRIAALAAEVGLPVSEIGVLDATPGVRVLDAGGRDVAPAKGGWRHA